VITPARDVEGEGCGASEVRRRIRAVEWRSLCIYFYSNQGPGRCVKLPQDVSAILHELRNIQVGALCRVGDPVIRIRPQDWV
jgi:hypothetical protein